MRGQAILCAHRREHLAHLQFDHVPHHWVSEFHVKVAILIEARRARDNADDVRENAVGFTVVVA